MAYEFLKKLFGEPKDGEQPKAMTYAELESAIDADKDLALYNLNEGGYVAKAKLDAKIAELKGTQKQLEDANAAIKGFEGQDVDGIKKQVEDWQKKYDTDTKALQEQIAASNRTHAEEMFLSGYQFTSKAARNGVLAEVRAKTSPLKTALCSAARSLCRPSWSRRTTRVRSFPNRKAMTKAVKPKSSRALLPAQTAAQAQTAVPHQNLTSGSPKSETNL